MKRSIIATAATLAAALVTAAPAAAHITANPSTTAAGGYALTGFNVGHGCDDAGTTKVSIKIPQDDWVFPSVTPYVNAGWGIEVVEGKLKEPAEVHGTEITEGVTEVVFTKQGEALPADRGDVLRVSLKLPDDAAGETIYFPVVQECEGGAETAWIQVPAEGEDAHELESPAASIMVTEAGDEHGHDEADDDHADEADESSAAAADDSDSDEGVDPGVALGIGILALVLAAFALFRAMRAGKRD